MTTRATDWETWIDVTAPALGLVIEPDWRPEVARFLGLAAGMAATVEAAPLADDRLDLDAVLVLPVEPR
jgi:hypothetical protein